MTAGAPWSVKGIHPKAREVAKDLARRSGMTLGEWLNRVILEDDAAEPAAAHEPPVEPPRRQTLEPSRPRLVSDRGTPGPEELGRIAHALGRLTDRIEASETRTGLAISGVEHSVRQAVARIEAAEREHLALAARYEGAVDRVDSEQARLTERLRRVETEAAGPRSTEALRALEQSVTRVAGRLYEAEGRTRDTLVVLEERLLRAESAARPDPAPLIEEVLRRLGQRLGDAEGHTAEALDALRRSLAALDARLQSLEAGGREAQDQRFEALAATLTAQVEAARAEVADRLKSTDAGRVDRRLAEMAARVEAAEQRSGQAIRRMGREVLAIAEGLGRRVQASDARAAEAVAQLGGEIARVASAVEARLGRAELVQAEALEKLGAEIGRITDRLGDRMLVSERRAAEAIDDVGGQVTRATERMEQRQAALAQDLAERIRESEERTAQLLAATRDRLEQRFREATADPHPPSPSAAPFGPALLSRAEPEDPSPVRGPEPEWPGLFRDESGRSEGFAPDLEPEEDLLGLDQPEPPTTDPDPRPSLSTREVIEQARAAVRAAAPADASELQLKAKASWRATGKAAGLFRGLRPRAGPHSTLQTALLVAGGAAFLSVGAAGVVLLRDPPAQPASEGSTLGAGDSPPRAAIALAPQTLGPPPAAEADKPIKAPRPPAQLTDALVSAYAEAVKGVEAREAGALARLKAIAEAGHPPAQLYLGKLYETGQFGVKQNLGEARRWTGLAAEGGDSAAMHNFALYAFRGEGGPQDLAAAAHWFGRAAEQGVVDSQYNLGLLHQSGSGVERDLVEAYRWFSIAALGGDGQARASALALEAKLSSQQLAAADKAVAAFRPAAERRAPAADVHPSGPTVAAAQRILGRLGYYRGPANGAASPELKVALAAYQRDQGLAATGSLDASTMARLSVFTR